MRYEFYKLEDVSIKESVLFRARVVVELDITINELKEVSKKVEELINKEFDALIIELYDEGSEFWKEGSLGSIEIYPYGRQGKALNINRIGRNRGGRTNTNLIIYLYDKDYRNRPTQKEYKIFRSYVEFIDFYGDYKNVPKELWSKFYELYKLVDDTKANEKKIFELINFKFFPWISDEKVKEYYRNI